MRGRILKAGVVAGAIAGAAVAWVAPAPGGAEQVEQARTYPGRVSGAQARRLVDQGALLVDVRTPAEYAAGHLKGARNLAFDEVQARLSELGGKDQAVVLYCRSGRRTAIASRKLLELGYGRVYDLGPMSAW